MQRQPNSTRRQFLGLAAGAAVLGAVPVVTVRPAEATPAMLASAIRNVTGGAAVKTGKVKLDVPPLVENGNTVPLVVRVDSPMAPEDHVYRNGVRIAVSTCSTGKPGHSTPTGVFVILEKDKDHKSSTYNDAPMPNMTVRNKRARIAA